MNRRLEPARLLLLAIVTSLIPATALATTANPDEYGIFAPVTIDPPPPRPAALASPPATEPPGTGTGIVTEPAPAPQPQPAPQPEPAPTSEPAPTLANLDTSREAEMTHSRYKIGKGYTVSSADGRFSLQIRARMQLRYDFQHPNVQDAEIDHIAQVRRARMVLMGNVFSPHVKYHFQFGFSPLDMRNDLPANAPGVRYNPLRDARVEFDRLRDFSIWVGQFKVPFSRQRVISSAYMNMVDRSIVNSDFNLDRDIGIQAFSKDIGGLGKLAYYVGVFMGEGRNAFQASDPGLLYVGRFEVNPFGKFSDYTEGDIERSKKPGLSIGAAYAFQDRAHPARGVIWDAPADGGTTNFHHFTADLVFKAHGVSLSSGFHLRRGFKRVSGGALDDMGMPIPLAAARQGLAWYGQLGWVVPKIPLEIVGRYGMIRNIYGDQSSQIDADEAGGGINYYFVGHDLKLQLDYFRLWDETMGMTYAEQAQHGMDRIRLQLQVYF